LWSPIHGIHLHLATAGPFKSEKAKIARTVKNFNVSIDLAPQIEVYLDYLL
jgi:hypothetical protein